ncbi:calmodulin-regulated spectrin-associated protein 1-B-like [Saccoglossus kowalevskii]
MVPPSVPTLPTMDDLLKDICDGCCLAVILHFYAPKLLNITDISIHQNMSFADSIYNLQVIKSFCTEYIPGLFALSCEDLLYTPPLLKTNIIVMLAELFWWLETERPDWVQPQGMKIERIQDKPEAQRPPSGSRIGFTRSRPLPISSVTKRSFQPPVSPSQLKSSNSNPEINKAVSRYDIFYLTPSVTSSTLFSGEVRNNCIGLTRSSDN